MKKEIIFGIVAFLLVLQAQTVFAADYDGDFIKAVGKNDFSDMEKILERRVKQMDLSKCMVNVLSGTISGFNKNNIIRVLELLTKYGAKVNDFGLLPIGNNSFYYEPPLNMVLLYYKNWDSSNLINITQFLLSKGANPNGGSNSILYNALKTNNHDLVKLLLNNGIDIDKRFGTDEYTPLMLPSESGNISIVKLLVENGAKVNLRNKNGSTAASIAYDKGEIEIYNYLKANGAIDFEPKQVAQQQAAPAQSTTNVYVQPSEPSSSSSSSSSTPSRNVGKEIADAFKSPLQSGTYTLVGAQEKISISAIAKSGVITQTSQGKTYQGTYNIDGNRMTVQIRGYTFVFNITSETSFSGHNETWVRTGF